ncbi:MAG: GTP-binding protein [Pseudomonadota bacterium]
MSVPRFPVTLLTGFLGAGKTTLLNAVLTDSSAGRVAVIVNEFGDAGLDHDLIEESSDEIVLMPSGCLCCSMRGDLATTIEDLLDRWTQGELEFERIVIETTGLADPGPILQTFLVDRLLAQTTRVDGVVTVADAANGPATLDAQFEAVSQAAMADLIVLSKTDLVTPAQLESFEARLRALNPSARIVHAVRGEGIAERIWGLSALHPDAARQDVLSWTTTQEPAKDPLANLSGLSSAAEPVLISAPTHDARITSESIILDDPISGKALDDWLDTLIKLRGPDILRVKGIVFLEGLDAPFVFHGVQHIFDPPVQLRDWPKGDRKSRIVVIARDISNSKLQRSLKMLRDGSAPTQSISNTG